ncbi:hypothetical protein RA27_02170 [Ruegeria sp. ANG-R]|uniref:hypothetical protein n=1 Tax=Ruegeria sp. ANG-R TaxID=1577903 RepID=UPI00057E2ACD|nr:hypothetical protein [Ruegeria sp. ANG-R]KIC42219.1 hypothetical protein RA27_02170 [Ruegeria sp. ANG-R]
MPQLSEEDIEKWERRRRNIRILITALDTDPTNFATSVGISPNTLTKFVYGKTPTLSSRTLDLILPPLGLASVDQLDTDNPLTDPRIRLQKIITNLDGVEQERLAQELEVRFSDKK